MEGLKEKRNLKDWLTTYLELTDGTEPPRIFRLWTGISVLASALERKCSFKRGFLNFYPNFFIVLIGPPASRKGISMGQGYYFLEELGVEIAADSITRQAIIKRMQRAEKKEIDKSGNGETITHSSLSLHAEEFTVLIGYKDIDFLTILGNWYDCGKGKDGKWENETICRQLETVNGVWVNILGGTTPTLLYSALPTESIGTGFISRIIAVNYKGEIRKKPAKDFTSEEKNLMKVLSEDLKKIHELKGNFLYSEELDKFMDEWYVHKSGEGVLDKKKFSGYYGRRTAHLIKLMMIVNASRTDEMILKMEDFEKAKEILEEVEVSMGRTYENFGKFEYGELLAEIESFLKEQKKVSNSKVINRFKFDADRKVIEAIIETLRITGDVKLSPGKKVGDSLIKWVKKDERER